MSLVIKKDKELKTKRPTVDEPRSKPLKGRSTQGEGLFKSARQLLETFGHARIGRTVFSDYAIEYQLKDDARALYYIFMVSGFLLDGLLAAFIIGLISVLLIAFVYVTLRGVNAWDQTVHIVRILFEYVHMPLPASV
jgi:hypothetical protein